MRLSGCTQEPVIKAQCRGLTPQLVVHSPAGCARPIQLAGMAVSLSSGLWSPSTAARSSLGLSVTYQTRLTEQTQNPRWQDPSFI